MEFPDAEEDFKIGEADGVSVVVGIIFGVFTIAGLVFYYMMSRRNSSILPTKQSALRFKSLEKLGDSLDNKLERFFTNWGKGRCIVY